MSRALALLRATHPLPTAAVTLFTVLLGVREGLEPWRLVVLGAAMALTQASIGLSNDWLDAARDLEVGRPDKPIVRGETTVAQVRAAAITTAVLAVPAALPLGLGAAGANATMLAAGWAYNLGLKRTVISPLPYLVGFSALPVLATLARPAPVPAEWWAVAAAGLLGMAAHVANVLPDLEDDARTGVRGLGHRIGRTASIASAWALLAAAAAVLALGIRTVTGLVAATVTVALAGGGLALRADSRWPFRLVIVVALIDVAALLLG